jgi:hypothetical protein
MLFALPSYRFPYIVMNRCLYLKQHDFNQHLVKLVEIVYAYSYTVYTSSKGDLYEYRIPSCAVGEECEAAGPAMGSADEKESDCGMNAKPRRSMRCVLGRCGQQESWMKKFLSRVV